MRVLVARDLSMGGMRVEKDQVVATLDDSTQQAQLDLAVSQAESARAALAEIRHEVVELLDRFPLYEFL